MQTEHIGASEVSTVGQDGPVSPYGPLSQQALDLRKRRTDEMEHGGMMGDSNSPSGADRKPHTDFYPTSAGNSPPSPTESKTHGHNRGVVTPNSRHMNDSQIERLRTPDSGAKKEKEKEGERDITRNTNERDTARMLAALNTLSCSADKLAAARELRHLVRNADDSYWAAHCPQVRRS